MAFFADRVRTLGFDGIDVHEAASFEWPVTEMGVLRRFATRLVEGK